MSMRISQRQMYSSFVGNMNKDLAALMESNLQGATEKQINRPSDDPAGAARVLMYRSSLNNIDRYKKNVSEAAGWLNLADTTLISVHEVLSEAKARAEQGSPSTMTAENRLQLSYALRGQLGELLNLANTEYGGQHIFAGHKTDKAPFVEALGVTCTNTDLIGTPPAPMVATGGSDRAVVFQYTANGTAGTAAFRFSSDGGQSWNTGTATTQGADAVLQAGGVEIRIVGGATRPVTAVDPANPNETGNGTWLYARPTAVYRGDDHDTQVVQKYGPGIAGTLDAEGLFTRDVAVRIDDATGPPMTFSFSLDDGANWTQGTAPVGATQLPIPGGFLNITGGAFANGQQFIVRHRRADIDLEISPNQTITVNNVGKDIFGGLYKEPFTDYALPVNGGGSQNIFEVMGRLIGYAETGSQQGFQQALDDLTACMKLIGTKATEVGGKENRLEITFQTLGMREFSETDAMSAIEDVDVTVLMTKLSQQQLAYNTVLKSSSMIMQMNLVNFL